METWGKPGETWDRRETWGQKPGDRNLGKKPGETWGQETWGQETWGQETWGQETWGQET